MQNRRFVLLVAAAALASCEKKDKPADKLTPEPAKPAAADAAPPAVKATPPAPPPGADKPFEATIEGKPYKFASAKIVASDHGESVVLSTGAGGCAAEKADTDTVIAAFVPRGPGGKHYAPGPLQVEFTIVNQKENFASDNSFLTGVLTLDPASDWKQGGKVKGTFSFDDVAKAEDDSLKKYTGAGSFTADVCELGGEYAYQALPDAADAGPAKGEAGGIKFEFKSGTAYMSHDDKRNIDKIQEITLYTTDVTCETKDTAKGPRVTLFNPGGARGPKPIVGSAQTVSAIYFKEEGKDNVTLRGPSSVKFDALDLKIDGEIKGTLHAEAPESDVKADPKAAGRISGSFSAKICK